MGFMGKARYAKFGCAAAAGMLLLAASFQVFLIARHKWAVSRLEANGWKFEQILYFSFRADHAGDINERQLRYLSYIYYGFYELGISGPEVDDRTVAKMLALPFLKHQVSPLNICNSGITRIPDITGTEILSLRLWNCPGLTDTGELDKLGPNRHVEIGGCPQLKNRVHSFAGKSVEFHEGSADPSTVWRRCRVP